MLRMIKWIGVPVLAVALFVGLDSPQAEAGNGFSFQIGRLGISTGHHGHGTSIYWGHNRRPYNSYYGAGRYGGHRGWYHDTTHYDYHPPQWIRHGNHYDYQPGHYDLHRSGHWHH